MATTTAPTTATGLEAARRLFRTDWDADGTTSVHLPAAIAVDLLIARGWTLEVGGRADGRWNAPDGVTFAWGTDEALQLALAAEVSR